jgi:prolyl-tRNA editing enzyme YbaK/EbsC (Cys-tRNA(Pro) deacylase)
MKENNLEDLIKKLDGEIINVGKNVKTVEQAAKAIGINPKQIIKSLVFISNNEPLLVIVDGESKVDLNKLTKLYGLVKLATPKEVKSITGYDVGGVPPVGVKIKTIVDSKVLENEFVIGGGGGIDKLSKLNPKKIVEYQKAEVINISISKQL